MKNVGILTFHRASNYGAVLQAYALQHFCEKYADCVKIINYHCPTVEKAHNPCSFLLSHGIKGTIRFPGKLIKFFKFERFRRKYLHLTKKVNNDNIEKIETGFELLIAGSDQLWNDKFSGMDEQYFFPYQLDAKKITYAISMGDSFDLNALKRNLSKYGNDIDTISLREEKSLSCVTSLLNKTCRVDIDPTFLLSTLEWKQIAKNNNRKKPYYLVYTIGEPINLIEYAKRLSAKSGCEIIYLNSSFSIHKELEHIRYSTPEEFIGWISNAEMVFTNSFHGTAFSVMFKKKFCVETNSSRGKNNRICELLKLLEMIDDNHEEYDAIIDFSKANWNRIDLLLETCVSDSQSYLREVIGAL